MKAPAELGANEVLGKAAFDKLRAEDEPWLRQCFVPPPEFDRLMSDRSIVVFGRAGCGKTALYNELRARIKQVDDKPTRLSVEWRPTQPPLNEPSDSAWVLRQVNQILDACATALAWHLACYPADFISAPDWARARFAWFIHQFTQGAIAIRFGPLLETRAPGTALLAEILQTRPPEVLYKDADPNQAAAELVSALRIVGLGGVWIMIDGLEGWVQADEERLIHGLQGFLAMLSIFEPSRLTFKLFVPSRLEAALSRASGLLRRRLDSYHLRWDTSSLQKLVEARLGLAIGNPFTLKELCDAARLIEWLERVGATSPREWLDQLGPLVAYYLENGLDEPIDEKTWKRIRRENPPRLYLDENDRRVIVGGREISLEKLPGKAYEMLRYLYEKRGIVTKGELYFRVYLGREKVPRAPSDDGYLALKEYENVIDNYILRLRKAIEPDPSSPVLLITVRGHGVRLAVRW